MTDAPRSLPPWVEQLPRWRTDASTEWVRYSDLVRACPLPSLDALDQRMIGHGEGQEHAIADVNAGLVDDLITPRLQREREQACPLPREELTLAEVRQLLGFLSTDLPELHQVEVPRLSESLDRFLAALDGSAREKQSLASMQASLLDTLKEEDDNV